MDIRLTRIDSRLIHGQVAVNWVKDVGAQTIICVGDRVAEDEMRKSLLLQAAPPGIKTNVLTFAKAARVYNNPKYEKMPVLLIVESPGDAIELIKSGVPIEQINVGGITFKSGAHQLSDSVFASDEDIAAFKELDRMGVKMTIQTLPSHSPQELMATLAKKGL